MSDKIADYTNYYRKDNDGHFISGDLYDVDNAIDNVDLMWEDIDMWDNLRGNPINI